MMVADKTIQLALRILHDLRRILERKTLPQRGTLNPDQRPSNVNPLQAGVLFYATDFDRVFRWNGSTWEDAPGQPARGMVAFFLVDPGTGWAACDGGVLNMTNSAGEVVGGVAPVVEALSGLSPWVRL